MLTTQIGILLLLLVACLSAVVFKRLHFPYTVGLVVIGFALGAVDKWGFPEAYLLDYVILSPDLILFIFVPPLIFESAINLDNRLLTRNLLPIVVLAGPGLILSMFVVGGVIAWLTPLALGSAILFGALISATDPVAVIALFKELGAPKRLATLVEGESMLNDATAIVAFEVVLFFITSGVLEVSTPGEIVVRVVVVLLGGILVGWIMGSLMGLALALARDDALIQATVSLITAYMTFIMAEHYLSVSGVIAVMTAGLVVGRSQSRRLAPRMRTFFRNFWEYAAFLANSLIFLLVGLSTVGLIGELHEYESINVWAIIGVAIAAAMATRGLMVFSLMPLCNPFLKDGPLNWRYQSVTFWGGLRGAVALALVLSLDDSFADKQLLAAMTLGVALFTIVVGGTSMGRLIHGLRLDEPSLIDRLAEAEAIFLARQGAVDGLDRMKRREPLGENVLKDLGQFYRVERDNAEARLQGLWSDLLATPELSRQAIWFQALALEQQSYQRIFHEHALSEQVLDKLHLCVELKRDAVLSGQTPPPVPPYESLATDLDKLLVDVAQPDSGAIEIVRTQTGKLVEEQRRWQAFQEEYEYDVAVVWAAEQVARQLSRLGAQHAVDANMAGQCAQIYWEARARTLHRLRDLQNQRPKLVQDLQRRLLHREAMGNAERTLEELLAQGFISGTNAANARAALKP